MIDLEHLKRQTAGDLSLQRELLELFLTQLDELAAQLPASGERPRDAVQGLLHRVRGAAGAIGAAELAGSLGEAEAQLDEGDLRQSVFSSLTTMIEAVRRDATDLIAAPGGLSLAKSGESR